LDVAVVGGGWAGLAAAVALARAGRQVTLIEAAPQLGGRARRLTIDAPNGRSWTVDNGQHILIGAYRASLGLLHSLGVDLHHAVLTLPLGLPQPGGAGLRTPAWAARWPAPADSLLAMLAHSGWSLGDRLHWLATAAGWRLRGFVCAPQLTVAELCHTVPRAVVRDLIEPLCVSALNVAPERASAALFLRVLRDALAGPVTRLGAHSYPPAALLLPRSDLGALLPDAASAWLLAHGHTLWLGQTVQSITLGEDAWQLALADGRCAHARQVVWATSAPVAARALGALAPDWAATAGALDHTAIATVYAWSPQARLSDPMLALPASPEQAGQVAQFVFDRGQLQGPEHAGLLALVVSDAQGSAQALEHSVMAHARGVLRLPDLQAVQTVVDKRATFACTPDLHRPPAAVAPGLVVSGDYVDGPYPATLEGAVRAGDNAAALLQGKALAWA
jgi:squalene-associated FAD-dependent desaturase